MPTREAMTYRGLLALGARLGWSNRQMAAFVRTPLSTIRRRVDHPVPAEWRRPIRRLEQMADQCLAIRHQLDQFTKGTTP